MENEIIHSIENLLQKRIVQWKNVSATGSKQHLWVMTQDNMQYSYKEIELSCQRLQVYQHLQTLKIQTFEHILGIFPHGNNQYGVLKVWLQGRTLEPPLWKNEEDALLSCLQEAAVALRKVHQTYKTRQKLPATVHAVERILQRNYLTEEQKMVIFQYITKHFPLLNSHYLTVIHGDFHLKNILKTEDSVVFIDLDDVKYGCAYMDLVYASNLHYTGTEAYYYYMFLQFYFNGQIPEDFWPVVNIFSIIKALEIIDCEKKHCTEDAIKMNIQSFIDSHNNLQTEKAHWYLKIEMKLATGKT